MRESLLEIHDLSCGYGKTLVLREIHCTIAPGELMGLIGPNGSGKTTLLRAVTRLLKPHRGRILLEGGDIWSMGLKEFARKVAVVPQIVEPVSMVVEEYVLLGRLPHYSRYQMFETRDDEAIARRYLGLTGVLHLKEAMMNEISGGERQLVSIARALAQEPLLLLLDEPTAHLDIAHQVRILDLIKGLNRRLGLTVFVVLHDLNLAGEYCDKVLLLREGLLVGKGTPEEVLTYEAVEETYRTVVVVERSPLSGKPHVFLVTGETMEGALSRETGEKGKGGRKRTEDAPDGESLKREESI
ncbi:MAG: ABC transporter ATP-binding protein [Deltaproteobacteria bacterium]|nr:ABC transporter ATP-binding protein [Deltaproteobacteria bacterium]